MKFSSDIVVFDLEASCKTFGINEVEESNIIEIGAVKLDKNSLEIKSEFTTLVKPMDFPVLPQIEKITGISNQMLVNEAFFDKAVLSFLEWYGARNRSLLAGWGLYYDLPLLRKEFRRFGINYGTYFVGGGFDIKGLVYFWLAKNNMATSGISIERVAKKFEIIPQKGFHRALDDARATARILQKIALENPG